LLKPTGTIWVTGTYHVYPITAVIMRQLGLRILNDIVWEKPDPPPNLSRRCFTHSTEVVIWAAKGRRYTFNYETMCIENGGRQVGNVWRGISPPSLSEKTKGKHPTQKPVALVERCLRASSNIGDVVFDPFAGSGTTGIAALNLGRRFIGCEQDASYAKVAVARLTEALRSRKTTATL
jgi:site-specific DNA-methyltransferase (adenine-specific)